MMCIYIRISRRITAVDPMNRCYPAYWSQTQVNIYSVVAYHNLGSKLIHQSYVFISDESKQDKMSVFAFWVSSRSEVYSLLDWLTYILIQKQN